MNRSAMSIIQVSLAACRCTRGLTSSSFGGPWTAASLEAISFVAGNAEFVLKLNMNPWKILLNFRNEEKKYGMKFYVSMRKNKR